MKKWTLCVILLLSLCSALSAQDEATPNPTIAAIIAAAEPTVIETQTVENYTATVTVYPCAEIDGQEFAYERLDVTNHTTNETRKAAEDLRVCHALGSFGLSILHFASSPAGDVLFYTDARRGSPDGLTLGWVRPVWRVNLSDFTVESIGQAISSMTGEELVKWDQTQISVVSVADGTSTDFPLMPPDLSIIDVTWLPLNSGVIYIQSDFFMGGTRNTVTHIDLETMEQTVILDTNE